MKVIFIVGTGGIIDSWRPVLHAVEEVGPPGVAWTPELANQFLAGVVYTARFAMRGSRGSGPKGTAGRDSGESHRRNVEPAAGVPFQSA